MQGLLHGLINHFGGKTEKGADPRRDGWPQMRDMIDLMFMQTDGPGQIHLDFIAGGDPAHELPPIANHLCAVARRGDIIARMAVFGSQKRVVIIEFAYGDAIRPGGPFGVNTQRRCAEEGRAAGTRMRQSLIARRHDRMPVERSDRDRSIIDDAVDDHLRHIDSDCDRIGCDLGDLPGQLRGTRNRSLSDAYSCHSSASMPRPFGMLSRFSCIGQPIQTKTRPCMSSSTEGRYPRALRHSPSRGYHAPASSSASRGFHVQSNFNREE